MSSAGDVAPEIAWPPNPYHWYESAEPLATVDARCTLPPRQRAAGPPEIVTVVGSLLTTTGALVALQPLPPVTITLYAAGCHTVIDCVVAPFDQRYEAADGAVSVTLPP